MTMTVATQTLPADWRDFFALTKPRVMSLVIFTGLCGLLAAPGHIHPVLGFTAILCIALGAAISIDTRKAAVMEAALAAGAHLINDVSGLAYDPRSVEVVARAGVPVVLMHAPGAAGEDLHDGGDYRSVALDVFDALRARRDAALAGGIAADRIWLDPGVGFGKSLAENLALINALPLFHALGHPLLLGVSRKRMIGALSNEAPAHERLGGSVALAVAGMDAGVQMLRVHDVRETVQARNVWRGLRDAALTDFGDLPG